MLWSTKVLLLAAAFATISAKNSFSTQSKYHSGNNIEELENLQHMKEPTCLIDIQEVQIMKVSGHCIKLEGGTPGCAAGSYLHPFHPDCLANI